MSGSHTRGVNGSVLRGSGRKKKKKEPRGRAKDVGEREAALPCQPFAEEMEEKFLKCVEQMEADAEAMLKKLRNYRKWYVNFYRKRATTSLSRSITNVRNLADGISGLSGEALTIQMMMKTFHGRPCKDVAAAKKADAKAKRKPKKRAAP